MYSCFIQPSVSLCNGHVWIVFVVIQQCKDTVIMSFCSTVVLKMAGLL